MKKIKTMLIMLLVIIIATSVFSVNNNLVPLPDKPTDKYMNLSKEDVWIILKEERQALIDMSNNNDRLTKVIKDLSTDITQSNKLLISSNNNLDKSTKLLEEKYPSNSLTVFLLAGAYYNFKYNSIGFDCYVNLAYKKYFYYNRVYVMVGAGLKFYDNYGGSINIGLGFNWK